MKTVSRRTALTGGVATAVAMSPALATPTAPPAGQVMDPQVVRLAALARKWAEMRRRFADLGEQSRIAGKRSGIMNRQKTIAIVPSDPYASRPYEITGQEAIARNIEWGRINRAIESLAIEIARTEAELEGLAAGSASEIPPPAKTWQALVYAFDAPVKRQARGPLDQGDDVVWIPTKADSLTRGRSERQS